MATAWQSVTDWVKSTPRRTFILFPLLVVTFEALRYRGMPPFQPIPHGRLRGDDHRRDGPERVIQIETKNQRS